MLEWQYYPKSDDLPDGLTPIIESFLANYLTIRSTDNTLKSNEVLAVIRTNLQDQEFRVEGPSSQIKVPVLFGRQGKPEKTFRVDAWNPKTGTVLEVEAGRAVTNYQFLKDMFEACVMHEVKYLAIAVRKNYRGANDFNTVIAFLETLYLSKRLQLPLHGILVIGY